MRSPPTFTILSGLAPVLARGWPVFLVADDCRTPIKADGWFEHGVHDATAEPDEIARRFARYPRANAALACGPASVLALDIDRKGDVDGFAGLAALEAEFGPIPATPCSRTPSGGEHRLFAFPRGVVPPNRVGIKRYAHDGTRTVYPGLDVRSAGASIALPPSQKSTGQYRWIISPDDAPPAVLPRWLLALMVSEPPPRPPRPPLKLSSVDRCARYVETAVNGECRAVATTPANSGRNLRLFQAAANLGELVGAGLLPQSLAEDELEKAAAECGLVRDDGLHSARATIASGLRKGLSQPREVRL